MSGGSGLAETIEGIISGLAEEGCVSTRLPDGGRLFIDRPLPFLCLYRRPEERTDELTERLVTTQASYLIAAGEDRALIGRLIEYIGAEMTKRFGAYLILELSSTPTQGEAARDDPYSLQPEFRILGPKRPNLSYFCEALESSLRAVRIHEYGAEVSWSDRDGSMPPDLRRLEGAAHREPPASDGPINQPANEPPIDVVGVEVAPIYRNEETGETYPFLFDSFRRQLGDALKKAFLTFAEQQTSYRAPHYLALGRRSFEQAVSKVDEGLARIEESFDFLLQITPVNTDEAWIAFEEGRFEKSPVFRYRPLPVDPEILKRRLFDLPIEGVEDPSLAAVFREKQEVLDRKITMLRDRDSRQFYFESLQLYGEIRPDLLQEARSLLEYLPHADENLDSAETLDAEAFAEVAAAEFIHYREDCDEFPETVHIRHDLPPGLMVSRGRLLIGHRTRIPPRRVDALLHHEVGTHMLTYFNGRAQPLRLLYNGTAGYESLQEGLAVLAEYLAGGLSVPRLRVLAGRVVAAQHMIDGATFVDVFRMLRNEYQFGVQEAFSIALRTFRGGGMIKDVIYLRGLHELTLYLQDGGDLEILLTGKISLHHLPLIQELSYREILRPAPLKPRYLLDKPALERLDRVRRGSTLLDMID